MTVDAHHHLWNPARGDYGWLPPDDPVLSRPYRLADIEAVARSSGIDRTVLVQAAPSVEETEYLLGIADSSALIAGVVGWIDFENRDHRRHLERWAAHEKFRGVRPMVQNITDDDWLLRPDIAWAFDAIVDLDLTFDALGFSRHASRFLEVVEAHPEMRVVLDHCLKPQIRDDEFDGWAQAAEALAAHPSVFCKLSGLISEAGPQTDADRLRRWSDHVIAAFGPERVMWGSDWPVSRLVMEYPDWLAIAGRLTDGLDDAGRRAIFETTAERFYRLAPHAD